MKTIYISGPMNGMPDLNKDAFDAAAELLRDQGFRVINPVELEHNAHWTREDYWRRDLGIIAAEVDRLVVLPGWELADGCKAEVCAATRLGIPVMDFLTSRVIPRKEVCRCLQ